MDCAGLVALLGCAESELHSAFRCGSRVYGTASPTSDEDFVVVLSRAGQKQDLAFAPGINVVVHGTETFAAALAANSVFALECYFAPPEHRLRDGRPPFNVRLDLRKLEAAASERSQADFNKAAKRFSDEPQASKKRLFHALRLPLFALQIARRGRIDDYAEASPLWRALDDCTSLDWEDYRAIYQPMREKSCQELQALAHKRR